jgi:hypothetical protein
MNKNINASGTKLQQRINCAVQQTYLMDFIARAFRTGRSQQNALWLLSRSVTEVRIVRQYFATGVPSQGERCDANFYLL